MWFNRHNLHRIAPSLETAVGHACRWVFIGIPPDLGRTETEVLGDTFDAITKLVSPPKAEPTSATNGASEEGQNGREKVEGNGGSDESPDAGGLKAVRIPASDILRILRAGAVDEYRRASPALSAACIYKEFAEGLSVASMKSAEDGARRNILGSSADLGGQRTENCVANIGPRRQQGDADGEGAGEDDRGRGVSKEEFCDFFEAVTDLIDLNGLGLVPQVQQGRESAAFTPGHLPD